MYPITLEERGKLSSSILYVSMDSIESENNFKAPDIYIICENSKKYFFKVFPTLLELVDFI